VTEDLDAARLRARAPGAFGAWDAVVAAAASTIAPPRRRAVEDLTASLLGGEGSRIDDWRSADLDPGTRAALELSEQFVLDVSSCRDDQRAPAMAALGAEAFPFVQVLYVSDLGTRMRLAWSQLFGADPGRDTAATVDLWSALESFMSSVARLDRLDPLTTEIVRLRGARAHDCRLCKSLRNVRAANGGADETLYDQIDHYESSSLSERHRVALRLVDAMLWQPAAHPRSLRDQARGAFTDDELVELVLDVARNAANKIAVVLAADEPHVAEGVEFYDVDARGELVYGLTPDP
jgi:alkylhydroperoxidase family enzyme